MTFDYFYRTLNTLTMSIANRVIDNIVKNVYVKLIFWFLLGAVSAILFYKFIRSTN